MWRPENWGEIKEDLRQNTPVTEGDDPYGDIFEVGANAMLNALLDKLDSCWNETDRLVVINQLLHERSSHERMG